MERVNKGEKYWSIIGNIRLCIEENTFEDEARFNEGNYFNSIDDCSVVYNKFRAVLKGADVIEMPNEEDAYNEEFKTNHYLFCEDGAAVVGAHQEGFKHCFEWLKSKIIK